MTDEMKTLELPKLYDGRVAGLIPHSAIKEGDTMEVVKAKLYTTKDGYKKALLYKASGEYSLAGRQLTSTLWDAGKEEGEFAVSFNAVVKKNHYVKKKDGVGYDKLEWC